MITLATFDLETTHLCADFGIILCGVVKPSHSTRPVVIRADELIPTWSTRRSNDRPVVKAIREELEKYDVLIAHNGLKFDLPFLRTRIAKHGLRPLADIKIVDPLQIARNKLRMSYNSLEKLATYLGVSSKTPVTGDQWIRAALDGDRRAMGYIVDHCVEDVATLERIVDAVKSYSRTFDAWGSSR